MEKCGIRQADAGTATPSLRGAMVRCAERTDASRFLPEVDKMAGGMFYWLMSINQVLWYLRPDSPLIATLEMDGWSFENGGYTREILPGQNYRRPSDGGGVSYFNIGPGIRQSVCDRLDFGAAITFATSSVHWAEPWFRFEVRFLF